MKNIYLTLIVISLVFGCKNEDESIVQPQEVTIVGNWKLIEWFDDVPRDINNDGQSSTDLMSQWNGCKKQSTLVLSSDHTGKIIYNGENNNPRCPPGFETNDFFTTDPWEIDDLNQELTLIGSDYFDSYEIVELTSESLILKGAGFFTCCDATISYFTGGYLKFRKE